MNSNHKFTHANLLPCFQPLMNNTCSRDIYFGVYWKVVTFKDCLHGAKPNDKEVANIPNI